MYENVYWEGVSCRRKKSVEAHLLGANNFVGTIPSEIFKMPALDHYALV
jgi:hypothetical protein